MISFGWGIKSSSLIKRYTAYMSVNINLLTFKSYVKGQWPCWDRMCCFRFPLHAER